MNTRPFKSLPIGATFRFASEMQLGWQGARGPWIKLSLRRYRHEHAGIEAEVGSWHVPVVEVAPPALPLVTSTNYADLQREHDAADAALRLELGSEYSLLSSEAMSRARAEWIRNNRGARDPQPNGRLTFRVTSSAYHAIITSGLRVPFILLSNLIRKRGHLLVRASMLAAFLSLPAFAAEPCKVNVNSASPEELQLLARTGPVLSLRLASGRPYKALEALDAVKGVGPSWMAVNGPHVAFTGPTTCTEKIRAPKVAQLPKL